MVETEPERECRKCRVSRPLSMFYVAAEQRKSAKLGYDWQHWCRMCNRAYYLAKRQDRVAYADHVKMDQGCTDCGIKSDHPEIYDFDHMPGAEKVANVANLLTKGTFEEFVAEIAKCEVVCANCHRIRTRSRAHPAFGKSRR